jgi:hypothetical protein
MWPTVNETGKNDPKSVHQKPVCTIQKCVGTREIELMLLNFKLVKIKSEVFKFHFYLLPNPVFVLVLLLCWNIQDHQLNY